MGIQQEEADKLISIIQKRIGLAGGIVLIPCDFSKKALAWEAKPNSSVQEGRYIIYNPTWVREVIGNDAVFAAALFGHELGHFINGHFGAKSKVDRKTQEEEADQFAGCAVARMGGAWSKLKDLLSRLRAETDDQYPDRLSSLQAARQGFTNCGGIINDAAPSSSVLPLRERLSKEPPVPAAGTVKYNGPAELQGVQVIIFKKESENARIENTLISNKILFSTRSSTESGDYNVITCTPDITAAAVRKLARLLTNAGLKIRAVMPSMYPQLRNRMTVETYANYTDRFNPLTVEEIDKIESCSAKGTFKNIHFTVHNNCPATGWVNFYIYYYDNLKKSWTRTHENDVAYTNIRGVTTLIQTPLPTNTRKFFVFAFGVTTRGSVLEWPNQNALHQYHYRYSERDPTTKNFRRVDWTSYRVDCD